MIAEIIARLRERKDTYSPADEKLINNYKQIELEKIVLRIESRTCTDYHYKTFPTYPHQNQRGTIFYKVFMAKLGPKNFENFHCN